MVLSGIASFALALWLVLWALGMGGMSAFILPALIILLAVGARIARGTTASPD